MFVMKNKRIDSECLFCSNKGNTKFTFEGVDSLVCNRCKNMLLRSSIEKHKLALVWNTVLNAIWINSYVHGSDMESLSKYEPPKDE